MVGTGEERVKKWMAGIFLGEERAAAKGDERRRYAWPTTDDTIGE
jgi:hypothetical protein